MIINPKVVKKVESSVQLPEYMSAKNFTFNGNACIGYVGNNNLPEIIIPKSYSIKTELVDSDGMLVTDIYSCYGVLQHTPIISATFTDGINTEIFDSSTIDSLLYTFQGTCYLTELVCADFFELADIINQSEVFLQYPITINGNRFASSNEARSYIFTNNIDTAIFAGQVEQISYIDGNDYKVTEVSCIEPTESGFKNYKNRIILLSNLTSIGDYAFYGCNSLTSIEIPEGVTSIGISAFDGCSSLSEITIPQSVTTIGDFAFNGCSKLQTVHISSSINNIGNRVFESCTSLISITVDENNQNYADIEGVLFDKDITTLIQYPIGNKRTSYNIPVGVTSLSSHCFYGSENIITVTIPNTIISFGINIFERCSNLTTVNFADNSKFTILSLRMFSNCTKLTNIEIPSSVTTIENGVFEFCTNLSSITIPDNVTSIESYVFRRCTNLSSIIIPDSVTSIESRAFSGCSNLSTVRINATIPPTIQSTTFDDTVQRYEVPAESIEAYKTATNWVNYADKIFAISTV